jgi:large subunit ribosomal protein L7Ae
MVEIDEKQGFSIIQKASETGKVKIGVNEVTKSIERGQAKAVFYANDVSPAEIVAHLPGLCSEMKIICGQIGNKAELGSTVGIKATTAIAIVDGGSANKEIEKLLSDEKEAKKKEAKEEAPVEEKKAEVKEEKKEETPAKATKEEAKEEKAEAKEEKKTAEAKAE